MFTTSPLSWSLTVAYLLAPVFQTRQSDEYHGNYFHSIILQLCMICLARRSICHNFSKGLFTWRWGTLGRWGNPPSRGRKIKRVYIQSYNPGVLGWVFLRLLLRLQLENLSIGVPSSRLEKDERLILRHMYLFIKEDALCYAVLGYARNCWLNTLSGIVWNMVDLQR